MRNHLIASISYVMILLLLSGCAVFREYYFWTSKWKYVSDNRIFPKQPNYRVTPSSLSETNSIRYDGVYIYLKSSDLLFPEMDKWNAYNYLRFWPSGEVYGTYVIDRLPEYVDADSFEGSYLGFYKVENNRITMEIYMADEYCYEEGIVQGDRIRFTRHFFRNDGGFQRSPGFRERVCLFCPIPGMTRQPDWSPTGMINQASNLIVR